MTAFWITLQIISAILLPVFIAALFILLTILARIALEIRRDKTAATVKKPPYDNVEFSNELRQRMISVRFIKDGEVIWRGKIDKEDIE